MRLDTKYRVNTSIEWHESSPSSSTLGPFACAAEANAAGRAWLLGLVPTAPEGEVEAESCEAIYAYDVTSFLCNAACQNCDWVGNDEDTLPIDDLEMRVSPGEIVPVGECPKCGALCQQPQPPTYSWGEEHPRFPVKDWQYEVANLDTLLGYSTWVEHQVESLAYDNPDHPEC